MTKYRSYLLSSLVAGALAIAPACGDDEKKDAEDAEDELEGDCKTISEACHHADEGDATAEAHECHELAHENDTEACTSELEHCQTVCAEHEEH